MCSKTTDKISLKIFLTGVAMSITEHTDEFHILSSHVEMEKLEYITMGRFRWGHSKAIRDIFQTYTFHTLLYAFQVAL